jgi:outer membrane protein assembly factor BamB
MQLVKFNLLIFSILLLTSCIGPLKEIKYQVEDSFEDSESLVNDPLPLTEIENQLKVNVHTSGKFDGQSDKNLKLFSSNNFIFNISSNGILSAVDLDTNKLIWTYRNYNKVTAGLSGNEKSLFYVDIQGYLNSINIFGKLDWKVFVGEVYSPPLVTNNQVIVKNTSSKIISSNLIDGSELWTYQAPSAPLVKRSWPELNYSGTHIYLGGSSGKLIAIDSQNGSFIWETTFSHSKGSSELDRSNEITSNLIIDNFLIYAVSSNGNIAAIKKSDGAIIWSRPLSSFNGFSADNEALFVTHSSGSIYKLSKDSNKILWRNANYIGRDISRTSVYYKYIIFSDYQGYLHFLNKNDGKELARIKLGDDHLLNPIIFKDKVFYASTDGRYYLISGFQLSNDENTSIENLKDPDEKDNNSDSKSISDNNSLFDSLFFWD